MGNKFRLLLVGFAHVASWDSIALWFWPHNMCTVCLACCTPYSTNNSAWQLGSEPRLSVLTHLVLAVWGEKPLPYAHVLEDLVPSWWGFLKEIIDWGCSYPLPSSRTVLGLLFAITGRRDFWEFGSHDLRTWPWSPARQLPRWVAEPPCFTFHLYFHSSTWLPNPSQLYFLQVSAAGEPRPGELVFWAEKLHMQWPLWHMTISFYFSELHRVRNYKPPLSIVAMHEPETCTSV